MPSALETPGLVEGEESASAEGGKNMVYEPLWVSGGPHRRFPTPGVIWDGCRNRGNGLRRNRFGQG